MPAGSGLAVGSSCASAAAATNSRYKVARVDVAVHGLLETPLVPGGLARADCTPHQVYAPLHLESRNSLLQRRVSGWISGHPEPIARAPLSRFLLSLRHARIETPLPNRHEPNRIRKARRRGTHYYSRNPARPRHHAGRISADPEIDGPHADAHRARHLQRDVERALLVQIVARAPEAAADAQPARGAGPGRERRHHRHRRRLGLRLQDRVAQSPFVYRAIPGRDDRRGRHSARHLHHGRAAGGGDGFAALRSDTLPKPGARPARRCTRTTP